MPGHFYSSTGSGFSSVLNNDSACSAPACCARRIWSRICICHTPDMCFRAELPEDLAAKFNAARATARPPVLCLYTDLNGYGRSLGIFHLEGFGRTKAQRHSKYVMYGYHTKHLEDAHVKYFVGVNSHYTGNYHNYGYYRYEGQYARYLLYVLSEKSF